MQDCLRILAYKGGSVYFVKAGDAPDVDYVYARMEQNGHVLEYPIEVNGDFIVDDASGLENYASSYSATVSDRGRIAYDDWVGAKMGKSSTSCVMLRRKGHIPLGRGKARHGQGMTNWFLTAMACCFVTIYPTPRPIPVRPRLANV